MNHVGGSMSQVGRRRGTSLSGDRVGPDGLEGLNPY
jgi:hypothetical protein